MKNPFKSVLIAAIISSFIVTGCSITSSKPVDQPAIEYVDPEIRGDILKKSDIPFSNFSPLTGVGTYGEVDQRIFAVMVNNHPKARPQSGLHKADLVYEILAEGSITRFLAIFQSELPDVVGPVRSARDYYISLSKDLGAIYVAYGGSPEAFEMLRDRNITDYIGGILRRGYADDQFFYRVKFRSAPHNVYITNENLVKGAETRHFSLTQRLQSLSFLSEEEMKESSGYEAKEIQVTYSNSYQPSYIFDGNSNTYTRYVNGQKDTDLDTKTPIEVSNILIIEAPHKVIDNEGRREINFNNGGKGYLFQLGTVQEIEWKKENGLFIPYIDGNKAKFVPGKTWVNVVPTRPGLETMISF